MGKWRPVLVFMFLGVLLLSAIIYITRTMADGAARSEAIRQAKETTEILATSVAQPGVTAGLVSAKPGAAAEFGERHLGRLLVDDVRRIKIWSSDGLVLYSDQPSLIGAQFELDRSQLAVLEAGGTAGGTVDFANQENASEPTDEDLVEVYTRIEGPAGEPLLFEAYYARTALEEQAQAATGPFERILIGGLIAMGLVAGFMLWGVSRRVYEGAEARERLLHAAMNSTNAERRRIARDLHDGVVQDLAGSAFSVAAVANQLKDGAEHDQLNQAATTLRKGLASLRTLLVEIYPPDLTHDNMEAALRDLAAQADRAQISASVSVGQLIGVSQDTLELVWRVAQEAIRNAVRHSAAKHLWIEVTPVADSVQLTVRDDGQGLPQDQASEAKEGGLGLTALASLVSDAGGVLDLESAADVGTTVKLLVKR